jgi:hypothetical protein
MGKGFGFGYGIGLGLFTAALTAVGFIGYLASGKQR